MLFLDRYLFTMAVPEFDTSGSNGADGNFRSLVPGKFAYRAPLLPDPATDLARDLVTGRLFPVSPWPVPCGWWAHV
jgi:hypothetical protein